jgi:outer membrane protein
VAGTASLTQQYLDQLTRGGNDPRSGGAVYNQAVGGFAVQSYGLTATQTLFNGLQTATRTRQAEGQVFSARETLRTTEQNVLLSAATAYMNLLQTAAIFELQRSNVNVLEVTLRQTRDRFTAGEVTRTDVAQAESRLAGGRSQLSLAESNYVTAQAQFLHAPRLPRPSSLAPAPPAVPLRPRTLEGAIARSRTEHPLITTSMYNVDIALQQVKIAEGALAPTLAAVGNVQKNFGSTQSIAVLETLQASIAAQLTVPLYQGGSEYAAIRPRNAHSGAGFDTSRDRCSDGDPKLGSVEAPRRRSMPPVAVTAAESRQRRARGSPRRPAHHADVLNAQQDLVNARVAPSLRNATASLRLYRAGLDGALCRKSGLKIEVYDPVTHYQQVRDAWAACACPTAGREGLAPVRAFADCVRPLSLFAFHRRRAIVLRLRQKALIALQWRLEQTSVPRGGTRLMTQPAKSEEPSMEEILSCASG